nr:hypothetical protein [Tanacetum cinerariifolium]
MFELLSGVLAWYRRKVRDDKQRPLISLKCISFNSKERHATGTTADKIEEALELQGEEISEGAVREVKEETGLIQSLWKY